MNKKLLIPITNSAGKQINQEMEYFVEINNKKFTYKENKLLKELKLSRNCVFRNSCELITKIMKNMSS